MSAQTFEAIVQAVLERRLVPFVGAGISFAARHPDPAAGEPHKTPEMVAALRAALRLKGKPAGDGLAELCERFLWRHRSHRGAYWELVGLLRIRCFAELTPAPAHRLLAFLAREGFCDEIFTTNYDGCLERAYLESWGIAPANPCEFLDGEFDERLARIWDLESYRAGAGLPGEVCAPDGRRLAARLKVYKLNGCACELWRPEPAAGSDDEPTYQALARSILLTELQLQDFRERTWARDLLRDRLRSKSLLFCGFGSPEPQVRHTVIQVLEEFGSRAPSVETPVNTPFVVCYRARAQFHQKQIVNAFSSSVGRRVKAAELILHAAHARLLWPEREGELRPRKSAPLGLSADFFFARLYESVMADRLRRALHPRSPAVAQLKALLPGADVVLQEIWEGLGEVAGPKTPPHALCRLLAPDRRDGGETPRLAAWLAALLTGPAPPGSYVPLEGHEQLAVELLVVLALLGVPADRGASVRPVPELGLEVTTGGSTFYLAAASLPRPDSPVGPPAVARLRAQILLACRNRAMSPEITTLRFATPGSGAAPGRLNTLRVARLPLPELLRQIPVHHRAGAGDLLARAVRVPSLFVDRRRERLRARLRRLEAAVA